MPEQRPHRLGRPARAHRGSGRQPHRSRRDRRERAPAPAPHAEWDVADQFARGEAHLHVGVAEPRNHRCRTRLVLRSRMADLAGAEPHVVVAVSQRLGAAVARRWPQPCPRGPAAAASALRDVTRCRGRVRDLRRRARPHERLAATSVSAAESKNREIPRTTRRGNARAGRRLRHWPDGDRSVRSARPARRVAGLAGSGPNHVWPGPCASLRRSAGSARSVPTVTRT